MSNFSVGIQLYTVRENMNEDFKGTLQKLADMGWQGVEFAFSFGDMEPQELREYLDSIGLKTAGVMGKIDQLKNSDDKLYEYAAALGGKYITISAAGEVAKDWHKTIKDLEECGKVAKEKGLQFTYHNHWQEFDKVDGKCALDLLYDSTDPEVVKCEIDTYWVQCGGEDPVEYIKKYGSRVPEIHIKDMSESFAAEEVKQGPQGVTELGSGVIDFKAVAALADEIGAEWLLYEQDNCPGDSLDSAKTSIDYLKSAGIV
ncbi:MAG: sugar phosphate isomerase/epimerase family protein [Planctomycetota bacterium]